MSRLRIKQRPTHRVNINNFLSGVNSAYDQSVLSPSVAADCYNFDFTSGALNGCKGFEDMGIEADAVWTFRSDEAGINYLMYSNKGEIFYRTEDGKTEKLNGITLTGIPKAIKYRLYGEDVMLICSPSDNMVVWNGIDDAYYVSSSPLITSMAMHYERMFVTTSDQRDTLWFSDDLDPTNWNAQMSEGGFIELADERGALIRVLGFLNYVYIFRERGISRLTAYADQSEFSISHLYVTSGRIFEKSIALCGDRVIFASSDGIYLFDGVSTKRILANLDELLEPDENSVGVYYEGKYYLALRANFKGSDGFDGDHVNNSVLIYDGNGYTLLRGYDVSDFYADDKLYAIEKGTINTYGGKCPFPKRWTMPQTDLGSGRVKKLKVLYIDTDSDISIKTNIDGKEKTFEVKGDDKPSRVVINIPGRKFGMTIDCASTDPRISRPQLTFDMIDR